MSNGVFCASSTAEGVFEDMSSQHQEEKKEGNTPHGYPEYQHFVQLLAQEFRMLRAELKNLKHGIEEIEVGINDVQKILEGEEGLVVRVRLLERSGTSEERNTHKWIAIGSLIVSIATLMFLVFQVKQG